MTSGEGIAPADPARRVLDLLTRAANERGSPLRWPVLATHSDGAPGARVVVLRAFDRAALTLDVHTDRRSPKCAEIAADPACTLVVFDPGRKVQMRIEGRARLHAGDDPVAEAGFRAASLAGGEAGLADYSGPPPGTDLDGPVDGADADPRANFAVIRIAILSADLLVLARSGHERWRVDFTVQPTQVTRLAP